MDANLLPSLSNFSTLECSTPTGMHKTRGSFSGWTDDMMSILKKYPQQPHQQQRKNETPHNTSNRKEDSPEPKTDFKPFKTLTDTNEKWGVKKYRIKKETSVSSVKSGNDTSPKKFHEKINKRTDLDGHSNHVIKEISTQDLGDYTPKVYSESTPQQKNMRRSELEAIKRLVDGIESSKQNQSRESSASPDTKSEVNTHNFFPKLKPKQVALRPKDMQNITVVFVAATKDPKSSRKRNFSNSSRKNSIATEEEHGRKMEGKGIPKRVGEEDLQTSVTSGTTSPHKHSLERKKVVQLKSFNNATLKFTRKNFMGMSVLSTTSKEVHLKHKSVATADKNYLDFLNQPETVRPDEGSHIQAFRHYLEKITRSNRGAMNSFKEKLHSAYGISPDITSNRRDVSEKGTGHENLSNRNGAGASLYTKGFKGNPVRRLDAESPRCVFTYEEIMIGNSMKVMQPPVTPVNRELNNNRFKYNTQQVLEEEQSGNWS